MTSAAPEPDERVVHVVHGCPSPDEVAALAAVLTALGADGATNRSAEPAISLWGSHERGVRPGLHPRPGGWRASALPR